MPAELPKEEVPVKDEQKEDVEPPRKKKTRRRTGEEKKEEGGLKTNKDEDDRNEEEAVGPEAEPAYERNEIVKGTKFRQDAVHVHGLDFLKTGHMEEIFGQFNHKYVEWINESSANVVFRDAASARKALDSLSYPKEGDHPWRRTPDILVQDDLPAVYLQMRLAAPEDKKLSKKAIPSMTPAKYVTENNHRNNAFTMNSLYEKKDRDEARDAQEPLKKGEKRTQQALPSAEIAKRSKRAERFAETLGEPPKSAEAIEAEKKAAEDEEAAEKAAADKEAAEKAAAEKAAEDAKRKAELDAEEAVKRKQRAERFAQDEKAAPAEKEPDEPPAPEKRKDVGASEGILKEAEPLETKPSEGEGK